MDVPDEEASEHDPALDPAYDPVDEPAPDGPACAFIDCFVRYTVDTTLTGPAWAAVDDVDGDGQLDIVVSAFGAYSVPIPPGRVVLYAFDGDPVTVTANAETDTATITVNPGVAVTFQRNAANTPAYLLATGPVIIEGTILLSASGQTGGAGGGDGGGRTVVPRPTWASTRPRALSSR
mgnify:CR=1 FL=1